MGTAEFLGMLVLSLVTLIGFITAITKPLNKNTKAMTELTMKIEQFAKRLDERDKQFEKHLDDFEKYKEHVRESQKRQWVEIDKHGEKLIKQEQELKHMKGE